MNDLPMPWYPVAGNHDVYWRGDGPPPPGHHETNYERHFGPLWYSFRHKNAGFIVLYSDEGDAASNRKGFNAGALQRMSPEQLAFLDAALEELSSADHVFVFLHHPRWIGGGYSGGNWETVHHKLRDAGNVAAVFAGHIHHMRYDGPRDGIQYITLATTGGSLSADIPEAGYLHHLNLITVRKDGISASAIPIGAVMDPRAFTEEFLAEIAQARAVRPKQTSPPLTLNADGSVEGAVTFTLTNSCPRNIEGTLSLENMGHGESRWLSSKRHEHFTLAAGEESELTIQLKRPAGSLDDVTIPTMRTTLDYVGESARITLPDISAPAKVRPGALPTDYFQSEKNRALVVRGASSALRVDSSEFDLPDGPMTIEAWVRPSDLTGYNAVIAKTQGSEFALFSDEGVPQFDIHIQGRYVTAAATTPMTVDEWTYLAGVFDGEQVFLFVNGQLAARAAGSGSRTSNDLPLYIGADPDSRGNPTRPLPCALNEVRLSRQAIYLQNFTPQERLTPDDNTVLLFHMDRQLGPFLLDHSDSAAIGRLGPEGEISDVAP